MVAVCRDAETAAVLVDRGVHVVLCGTDGTSLAATIASLRQATTGPNRPDAPCAGRVAAFVGDLFEPEVVAAALAMAGELFGAEPVLLRNDSDLPQLLTRVPGPEEARSGTFEPPFDSWSNPTP
ncbi:MAG: hypothetical protein QOF30_1328 [Acidimicrobiaceae bacterium]|nr:hypothetical protein [Acidimicrobiaceae bacterium]